jgi:hypothetical protein
MDYFLYANTGKNEQFVMGNLETKALAQKQEHEQ